jgi:hypothetical protein
MKSDVYNSGVLTKEVLTNLGPNLKVINSGVILVSYFEFIAHTNIFVY